MAKLPRMFANLYLVGIVFVICVDILFFSIEPLFCEAVRRG